MEFCGVRDCGKKRGTSVETREISTVGDWRINNNRKKRGVGGAYNSSYPRGTV